MNIPGAIIAGLIGTIIHTMVMRMAPKMGLPKMDIVGLLGSMFGAPNRTLGMALHLMMGIVFALLYALLWSQGVGSASLIGGLAFGIAHWLIVGLMMAGIPMMHAGIRSGAVPAPGPYMTASGGAMAFVGGLFGHMVFGIVVALVYLAF